MLKFKTTDGSETWAKTASLGLLYWYGRTLPNMGLPKNIPEGVVLIQGKPQPGPYHSYFLRLVTWAIERIYGGIFFDIDENLLHYEWYEELPEGANDFAVVAELFEEGNEKIVLYENTCMGILNWLHQNGDIKEITNESE